MSPSELPGRTGPPPGLARDAHDAAHGLDDDVQRGSLGVGAGLTEAGDGAIDEAGIHSLQIIVGEAEIGHGAGDKVLHEDITLGGNVFEYLLAVRVSQVESDALFSTVDADEVVALPLEEWAGAAGEVAALGALDLYDLRAHVG